jgi:prepilin-type N-terminal cleavage/methylation domain-containing protein
MSRVKKSGARGFTLIEMLVVIGIITIVSALVLANNNKFGGRIQLQNLAYDIGLAIREAQVYGISVQRFNNTTSFAPAYGMYFTTNSPTTYLLFGDNTPNGVYDIGAGELVEQTTIRSGYTIDQLYATPPGESERAVTTLNITFRRPDPDAYISREGDTFSFDANGDYTSGNLNESARIIVRSPRGDLEEIRVSINGQISVQ